MLLPSIGTRDIPKITAPTLMVLSSLVNILCFAKYQIYKLVVITYSIKITGFGTNELVREGIV